MAVRSSQLPDRIKGHVISILQVRHNGLFMQDPTVANKVRIVEIGKLHSLTLIFPQGRMNGNTGNRKLDLLRSFHMP
jgi:hypothetical protein